MFAHDCHPTLWCVAYNRIAKKVKDYCSARRYNLTIFVQPVSDHLSLIIS